MDYGHQLIFPLTPNITNPGVYAKHWLTEAWQLDESAISPNRTGLDDIVGGLLTEMPPLVDRDAILSGLPRVAIVAIEQLEKLFIDSVRSSAPLLKNETIKQERISVLGEPWSGFKANTIVYQRDTNLGTMILLYVGVTIDTQTGEVIYAELPKPQSQVIESPQPLKSDSRMSAAKAALNVFQMIAFACGPEGVIIAGGIGVLQILFALDADQTAPDLPVEINQLVEQDLANDHILEHLATILSSVEWLNEQNTKVLNGEMPAKDHPGYAEAINNIKEEVHDTCKKDSVLRHAIDQLRFGEFPSDPPFQILAFPSFLLGASVHLMYERIKLLLSNDITTFNSPEMSNLVNIAESYLNHAKTVKQEIEDAIKHRLNGISTVQHGQYLRVSVAVNQIDYLYIQDAKRNVYPERDTVFPEPQQYCSNVAPNTVWCSACVPPNCCGDWTCNTAAANKAHTNYIANVTKELQLFYNYTPDVQKDIDAALAQLQKDIDVFKQAIP